MTASFSHLPIRKELITNLESLGFAAMTPIQAKALPHILQGRDLIAQAKTGSGKTAAFSLGMLNAIQTRTPLIQALVLCPTRELADQVAKEIRRLARLIGNVKVLSLCGGTPGGPQRMSLEHGAHIVVGTPGRIHDHLQRQALDLRHVTTFVLDEADRMLAMGFSEAIAEIATFLPKKRQTLLFSATFPSAIELMSQAYQSEPLHIKVDEVHKENQIEQAFYAVDPSIRAPVLLRILRHHQPASALIFCTTKIQCQEVALALHQQGFSVLALHSDFDQFQRDEILTRFTNRSCSILVATDVAARGLDIQDLEMVINFEVSRDPEVHVHRIGRTARAGKKGVAISLFTPREKNRVEAVSAFMQVPLQLRNPDDLPQPKSNTLSPAMCTIKIGGGKKSKIRPGDILGALTKSGTIPAAGVGKIEVRDFHSFVAVTKEMAPLALTQLQNHRVKGMDLKAKLLQTSILDFPTMPVLES
jgi:ATP-independent RNA helicase DbpA